MRRPKMPSYNQCMLYLVRIYRIYVYVYIYMYGHTFSTSMDQAYDNVYTPKHEANLNGTANDPEQKSYTLRNIYCAIGRIPSVRPSTTETSTCSAAALGFRSILCDGLKCPCIIKVCCTWDVFTVYICMYVCMYGYTFSKSMDQAYDNVYTPKHEANLNGTATDPEQ